MPLNIPESKMPRVVVAGGGFAGLELVRRLSRRPVQLVLLDRNNFHNFQPLMYQVATSALNTGDIAFPFRKVFRHNDNVHFRMTEVTGVDPDMKKIVTSDGELSYDLLVMATGSATNYFGMKDVEKNSMPMKELYEALAIRNTVLKNLETAAKTRDEALREALLNIVIVGGGATGVELAGAFSEMKDNIERKDYHYSRAGMKIWLVEGADRLLAPMGEKTSADTLKLMGKLGVEVILNDAVTGYAGGNVMLKSGVKIPTRNLIWTSGVKVEVPAGLARAATGRGGRIEVDNYLKVKGYEDIYAAGDMALQSSAAFPGGAPQQARYAIEQAKYLAKNIVRRFAGKEAATYNEIAFPSMAEVSRNNAFAVFRSVRLKGFAGWLAWVFIHILTILGVRNRFSVMWNWFWNYIFKDLPNRLIIVPRETKN